MSEEQKDARIAELEQSLWEFIGDFRNPKMSSANTASRHYLRVSELMAKYKPEVGREWPPAKAGS